MMEKKSKSIKMVNLLSKLICEADISASFIL